MSLFQLLKSRRYGPIFTCIALGAFNDNYYKNALIILTTYSLATKIGVDAGVLISIASASFILPFFLFSGLAGEIADHMPKHRLVRILKSTELILVTLASIALMYQHAWGLMIILFLLGMQSAFFGPAKYAILPELLFKDEILLGNGMIEAGTFLCILLGTLLGGLLVLRPHGIELVAATLMLASALGLLAAWRVPVTHVMKKEVKLNYNVLQSTWQMVRQALTSHTLMVPIMGISWFWAIGAIYLTQLPIFTKEVLGANERVVTLFNGLVTVGIALGSFACPYIMQRLHARNLSPLALTGVFLFGLDLCWVGYHTELPTAEALVGLLAYLRASFDHVRLALDLFLMAFCGGIFIVPLYTQLQTQSAEHERARTIASNNVMNALLIASASLLAAAFFALHFTVLHVLLIFALLNIPMILLLRHSAGSLRGGRHS
jgi:acyl-[acyl-carrier-protein]-phospholipid O-acyltransferase/long-chain-fatty-acid--[acyl-carrier-protein] ligase